MDKFLEFLWNNIELISGWVLSIAVISTFWKKALATLKEGAELIMAIVNANADGKLTAEELKEIEKEYKDVVEVFKKMWLKQNGNANGTS